MVRENELVYTKEEVRRAKQAYELVKNSGYPLNLYGKDFSCRNPDYPQTINTKRCSILHRCISELQIGLFGGFSFIETT